MIVRSLAPNEVPTVVSFIEILSGITGLPIRITDEVFDEGPVVVCDVDNTIATKRKSLAWLESQASLITQSCGNWVAIYSQRIIASGPDESTVLAGASKKLGGVSPEILMVPIGVAGSEERWETIRMELGLH